VFVTESNQPVLDNIDLLFRTNVANMTEINWSRDELFRFPQFSPDTKENNLTCNRQLHMKLQDTEA